VESTVGAKVPELLARALDPSDREQALAASVVIAGVVGHPRQDPLASLSASCGPTTLMRHTWVDSPQAEHIQAISGRVQVRRCE
jgi:hypothetical protein